MSLEGAEEGQDVTYILAQKTVEAGGCGGGPGNSTGCMWRGVWAEGGSPG